MLLGREAECTRLDGLLELVRSGKSATLVIRGEPGVGKSALLRYAIDRAAAAGMTTLLARGIESESELAFAGLADLIRPIRHALSAIPPAQSAVLAGALALAPPVPSDRFACCAATLSMLAAAAERAALLVVIDDIQWLDASSAEAVLFAARRLEAEGVGLLLAIREGESTGLDLGHLPVLRLGGLADESAVRLLASLPTPVAPPVAIRLQRAVAGNPLALIEIVALLSEAQRAGNEPLPDPLPAGPRLEEAFHRRLQALPPATQRALLVVAANESTDTVTLYRALEHLQITPSALHSAESAGLIVMDGVMVRFHHPLIRSAVYHSADPVMRREAHGALAAALDAEQVADRRAWHLAAATPGPDESIAAALERAALRSQSRSGYGAAARALARAATLSPSSLERARRLVAAANASQMAGRPSEALHLLEEATDCQPQPRLRSEIEHLRAEIEMWRGTPMVAHQVMLAEAALLREAEPAAAALLMAEAAIPCFMAGEISRALETARQARALADQVSEVTPVLVNVVLAEALVLSGNAQAATPLIDDAFHRVLTLGPAAARDAQYLPFSLVALERYAEGRALIGGAVSAARAASAVGILPYGLAILSEIEFRTGNFAAAYAAGTESVRLAQETGQRSASSYSLVTLARVEAAQGRDGDCRGHVDEAFELARAHGLGSIFNYSNAALGLLELGRGRPVEAIIHLEEAARVFREQGVGEPNVVQWQPDFVESLARAGRPDDALSVLAEFEQGAQRTDRMWAKATAARCRGYLADENFAEHFARALELHRSSPTPSAFEIARTQLCFGEVLRRHRHRIEARQQLSEALVAFERLGAEPWANRARTELSATGEKARKRDVAATRELTPQELQIALAVAAGATNREAAAQLFLSHKTVEAHLSSAYRKLNIRSRTELVRLFTAEPAAARTITVGQMDYSSAGSRNA